MTTETTSTATVSSKFNRGKLRRMVERGEVEVVRTYSYSEMSGTDRTDETKVMPAEMHPGGDWRNLKPGICYFRPDDFSSGSGCAWQDRSGLITLVVHSNSNYTFRIKPKENKNG